MKPIVNMEESDYNEKLLQAVALLPWGQIILLLKKGLVSVDHLFRVE